MALLLLLTQDAGAPDVTAPTVVDTLIYDGPYLALTLSENVQFGPSFVDGTSAGFTLTPTNGGSAITLATYDNPSYIVDNAVVFDLSRAASSTETFTLSHSGAAGLFQDIAGNDIEAFSGLSVVVSSSTNSAPSDIYASASTISVNAADGAQLCVMTAVDPDPGETFTWALVAGTGDTNNADVAIGAATGIVTVDSAATLGVGSYTFRVQVTDSAANTRAEAFAFSVVEPPSSDEALVMTAVRSLVTNVVKLAAR